MNTKKVIKRLSAVGAGAIMLGATVMGAFAVDLSDYPDMFVSDGTFDGYFVVGEAASSTDNLAMTDIATNMYYVGGDASTTTTVEGDAWLAATSSNFLELAESVKSVESYLDDTMLSALADVSLSNSKGTADYEQFLYFDENQAVVEFQEDDDEAIGYFYKINSSAGIARFVVDFTSSWESDVDSNADFDDIEDEILTLFGRSYTVTEATNDSDTTTLVLMGGSTSATLEEGDVATYEISGVEYEVELLSVTSTEAQFSINGETTSKLSDSETDVLSDGVTNIGVTDITYQDYAGGIHSASFFLGADKLELKDGSDMKVNEETINDAAVLITETYSGGDVTITEISINMTAEDDLYVGEGMKLSEAVDLDEPEVLFTENWDMELVEVSKGDTEATSLVFTESDQQADLQTTLYSGDVSVPLVFTNSTGMFAGEKEAEPLVAVEYEAITKNDYFFLSTADPTDDQADAKSYLLQYKGTDATTDTSPKAQVRDVASGETHESSVDATGSFDLRLGGVTYTFVNTTAGTSDDFKVNVSSLASSGNSGIFNFVTDGVQENLRMFSFRTADNHWVRLSDSLTNDTAAGAASTWGVEVMVDDADKVDDTTDIASPYVVLNVTLNDDDSEDFTTTVGTFNDGQSGAAHASVTDPSDSDISYYHSSYGESLIVTSPQSGPDKYELVIPEEQAEVLLYVTSGATESTSTVSGDLALVSVVDATRLDSEVASVDAQNMIVVGGPCVNTVAAELMGNPSDCAEGFTPGVANVKLFENGDSVAMLVAGYSGTDTRLAGRVMAHRWDELSGEEVEIEGSTYSDATISEPSEEVAVEEEEEASEE
ncbi:hypothetical protein HOC01_05965 [archaeon]|nr:hypothetical protein [archaeon]MBT6697612.1 hypothetical protein [archaeon]